MRGCQPSGVAVRDLKAFGGRAYRVDRDRLTYLEGYAREMVFRLVAVMLSRLPLQSLPNRSPLPVHLGALVDEVEGGRDRWRGLCERVSKGASLLDRRRSYCLPLAYGLLLLKTFENVGRFIKGVGYFACNGGGSAVALEGADGDVKYAAP